MAESKPKLGYWHIRGLAAQIRYMLHYAKVDFEDVTYEMGPAPEWSKACWFDVKPNMGLDFPNLPYFFDGELNLTETAAIMKYIAHKWAPELLGKSSAEYARAEMMQEHCGQVKRAITMPAYTGGDDITCKAIFEGARPHLDKVVAFMAKYQHAWVAGNNLTWLDFAFWEMVDYMCWLAGKEAFFEAYPSLKAYHERFLALPAIAAVWSDDKKCQKYPFNNAMAKIGGRDSKIMPQ